MDAKAELARDWLYGPMTVVVAVKKEGRPYAKVNIEHAKSGQIMYKLVTPQTTADIEIEPKKMAKVNFHCPMYTHKTEIVAANKELVIKSDTTKRGRNIATVNAAFSRRRPSFLVLDSPEHQMRFELEPFQQEKLAKLIYTNSRGANHATEATYGYGKMMLKSKTVDGQNIVADIDAKLTRPRSEIRITSDVLNAKAIYEQSKINVEVRGKKLNHFTNINWMQNPIFKTTTQINGKERFQLNGAITDDKLDVQALNDLFEGTLMAAGNQITFDFKRHDYRRAPRITGVATLDRNQREIRAEINWNADSSRDRDSRVVIVAQALPATVRGDRKHRAVLNIQVIAS